MREYVQGRFVLVPDAPVKVVTVLRDICQVNDSEDRRMVRPCVGIIWRRLAEIIEACPYELAYAPRIVLVCCKILVRNIGPVAVSGVI